MGGKLDKRTTTILLIAGLLIGVIIGLILVSTTKNSILTGISTNINQNNQNPQEAPGFKVVEIYSNQFYSEDVTIKKGASIEWINMDSAAHQVETTNGKIVSNVLQKGDYFDYKFTETGTYEYYCKLHPTIKGKITVTN